MARYDHKLVSEALTISGTVGAECVTSFAERVCKELRVKMHGRDRQSYWLYRDDCPYCLGWVGYGDYRNGGDGTNMYVVNARTIENGKYSDYSPQYFMKMSTNIDTAVRNAKKFIRMMSPIELAQTRLKDATEAVDKVVQVEEVNGSSCPPTNLTLKIVRKDFMLNRRMYRTVTIAGFLGQLLGSIGGLVKGVESFTGLYVKVKSKWANRKQGKKADGDELILVEIDDGKKEDAL